MGELLQRNVCFRLVGACVLVLAAGCTDDGLTEAEQAEVDALQAASEAIQSVEEDLDALQFPAMGAVPDGTELSIKAVKDAIQASGQLPDLAAQLAGMPDVVDFSGMSVAEAEMLKTQLQVAFGNAQEAVEQELEQVGVPSSSPPSEGSENTPGGTGEPTPGEQTGPTDFGFPTDAPGHDEEDDGPGEPTGGEGNDGAGDGDIPNSI